MSWREQADRLLIQWGSSTAAGRGQCRSPWADEEFQVSKVLLRQSRDEGTSEVHWDHRLVTSWWVLGTEADFQHFINSISFAWRNSLTIPERLEPLHCEPVTEAVLVLHFSWSYLSWHRLLSRFPQLINIFCKLSLSSDWLYFSVSPATRFLPLPFHTPLYMMPLIFKMLPSSSS